MTIRHCTNSLVQNFNKTEIQLTIDSKCLHNYHIEQLIVPHQLIYNFRAPRYVHFNQMNMCLILLNINFNELEMKAADRSLEFLVD